MTTTRVPVVFIHGLWLHATSWQAWADRFAEHGYDPVLPGWPNEPATVAEARANPEAVAGIGIDDVTAHYTAIIDQLPSAPVLVGHSFGGLFVQKLLGLGLGRAGVAIDPAQIKGVKALPLAQLRSGSPVLGNPANRKRSVALTRSQFRYGFGNAVSEAESDELFEKWAIPSPGRPLFEAAFANFSRNSPAAVNTANADRGPLLIISGGQDHTVPDVVTRGTFKQYAASSAVTELQQFPDRGHSLALDNGWGEIADASLTWLSGKAGVTAA
ncbi:alpha/beta hydrolase [Kineosporia succinea]|uniref:Pimeloyl-ACP methyl ester carboxylesterase n=1 Tax=Kineosporia succinea TaxID=84632 RepID=A0ABT9PE36_9ACTN|nr:alpha/beta hydrolase [Kineosporia succinea]MDP9830965.1 pimeloyl-ACP methyl ester carboxylesterase [Kineosporia succinea]